MGFLDSIFGGDAPREQGFWNQLSEAGNVDEVFLASNNTPQIILKHSYRCGTSYFAKKNLESIEKEDFKDSELHLIDVIRSRAISNYLADKAGVRHESPQVFVIKKGEVVWHASHGMVTADNLIKAIS